MIYLVMGVSGSGKSTIGQALSQRTGIPFYDADDYHPVANVEKMASGQPLNDHDRQPWLERLAELLQESEQDNGAILACSALKVSYRKTLVSSLSGEAKIVFLKGSPALISARMQARKGHFMPPALLASQFDTLEIPVDALVVDIEQAVDCIVANIMLTLEDE